MVLRNFEQFVFEKVITVVDWGKTLCSLGNARQQLSLKITRKTSLILYQKSYCLNFLIQH
jgi:hypothetical protein